MFLGEEDQLIKVKDFREKNKRKIIKDLALTQDIEDLKKKRIKKLEAFSKYRKKILTEDHGIRKKMAKYKELLEKLVSKTKKIKPKSLLFFQEYINYLNRSANIVPPLPKLIALNKSQVSAKPFTNNWSTPEQNQQQTVPMLPQPTFPPNKDHALCPLLENKTEQKAFREELLRLSSVKEQCIDDQLYAAEMIQECYIRPREGNISPYGEQLKLMTNNNSQYSARKRNTLTGQKGQEMTTQRNFPDIRYVASSSGQGLSQPNMRVQTPKEFLDHTRIIFDDGGQGGIQYNGSLGGQGGELYGGVHGGQYGLHPGAQCGLGERQQKSQDGGQIRVPTFNSSLFRPWL